MSKLPQPATIIGNPVSPYVRKVLALCEMKELGLAVAADTVEGGAPRRGPMTVA